MPRGIANTSGVSCHLTSALQLIHHCLPSLRKALIELADLQHAPPLLRELGRFFGELQNYDDDDADYDNGDCDKPVDPTMLYKILEKETTLQSNDLGDAVRALRTLLQAIRSEVSTNNTTIAAFSTLTTLLDLELHGRMEQVVTGRKRTLARQKAKACPQACPFAVPSAASVTDGLLQATMEPQEITGYSWDHVEGYQETQVEDSLSDTWVTSKTSAFQSIPATLLLHLQRYSFVDGQVEVLANPMDVPLRLDVGNYCKGHVEALEYELTGCLLHVSGSPKAEEGERGGHYIALIRQGERWILLDDEDTTQLHYSEGVILDFLSGRPSNVELKAGTGFCAMLLVYSAIPIGTNETINALRSTFLEQVKEEMEQQPPELRWDHTLIGRRAKILWAKGKYYAGTVIAYNDVMGKHKVKYDDGDVKEYNLRQKTVEWI
jgi:uncharacterized UBP type Zn finger protein